MEILKAALPLIPRKKLSMLESVTTPIAKNEIKVLKTVLIEHPENC